MEELMLLNPRRRRAYRRGSFVKAPRRRRSYARAARGRFAPRVMFSNPRRRKARGFAGISRGRGFRLPIANVTVGLGMAAGVAGSLLFLPRLQSAMKLGGYGLAGTAVATVAGTWALSKVNKELATGFAVGALAGIGIVALRRLGVGAARPAMAGFGQDEFSGLDALVTPRLQFDGLGENPLAPGGYETSVDAPSV